MGESTPVTQLLQENYPFIFYLIAFIAILHVVALYPFASLTFILRNFVYLNQNYSVLDYHNLHRVRAKEACEGTIEYGVKAVGLIISLGFPVTGVL